MRKQQLIWQKEHSEGRLIPSETEKSSTSQPSSNVIRFIDLLRQRSVALQGKAVDIGAGKGRNTIYLHQQGFSVYALDYIQSAIDHISDTVEQKKLQNVTPICMPIDEPWQFPDNYFDVAIDCFASIDIETSSGRQVYRNEMLRTLKSGAYALVVVVAAEDEFESKLIRQYPGSEMNSSIWPMTGKFQKNYEKKELTDFYDSFEVVAIETLKKTARKMGKDFITTKYWLVLRKN